MISLLESDNVIYDGKEVFIGQCRIEAYCISKLFKNKYDIRSLIEKCTKQFATIIHSKGKISGELLPYANIYEEEWEKPRRDIISGNFAAIDIVNVLLSYECNWVTAHVMFTVQDISSMPYAASLLKKAIKENQINIQFRPNLLTFDIYNKRFYPHRKYQRKLISGPKIRHWGDLIELFSSNESLYNDE